MNLKRIGLAARLAALGSAAAVLAGMPASAAAAEAAAPLRVAAAASLERAVFELSAAFTKATGVAVQGTYSASGKLVAQIREGAPIDVFLAADTDYPGELAKAGFTAAEPVVFAKGPLVLWTTGKMDLTQGLPALRQTEVNHVAVANPKVAPYGRVAVAALERAGLTRELQPKLVFGESVAQVNHYVSTGAAEVGLTAKASVPAGTGHTYELPAAIAPPLAQGAVVTKLGGNRPDGAASAFVAFLSTPGAQAVLETYGYLKP